LEWLKQGLLGSTATWKIISADVPISIPTGTNAVEFGRDGWASGTEPDFSSQTGFEREFLDLLTFIDDNDIQNVVFVVTDVHFAMSIRYDVDANGDGDPVVFHEFVIGPLNAVAVPPPGLDPTFHPTILYQEGDLLNFGYVRIAPAVDGTYHLIADVRGEDGLPRPGSTVELVPAQVQVASNQ
jgi:alkaline phosphatase D